MDKHGKTADNLADLRGQAEKKLAVQLERIRRISAKEVHELVHELGTHQIELEMQNEELRSSQAELEASRSRYAELYDLAPVGYFTFDPRGLIKEVNLLGAQMLGVPRAHLIDVPFAPYLADDEDLKIFHAFYRQAFTTGIRKSCELRIRNRDNRTFPVQLQGMAVENIDDKAGRLRVAAIDMTEQKAAEQERERLILERMEALSKVKILTGLLPICMHCKRIRSDDGYWSQLEAYISGHSEAEFSHGLCDDCAAKLYPRYFKGSEGS